MQLHAVERITYSAISLSLVAMIIVAINTLSYIPVHVELALAILITSLLHLTYQYCVYLK